LGRQEIALLLVISFQDDSVAGLDYGFEEFHRSFGGDDFSFPERLAHFGEFAISNCLSIGHHIGLLVAKFPSYAGKVKSVVADRVNQQAREMKADAIKFARKISPILAARE
jgi:hypothetical protein